MQALDVATQLFYSDDPERLSSAVQGHVEGVVFDSDFEPQSITRLLAYHVNGDETPRFLSVRLLNFGYTPTTISYVASIPKPSSKYMEVGHQSTLQFMQRLLSSTWTYVELPARGNLVLEHCVLNKDDLFAALLEFRTSAASVRCSLVATESAEDVLSVVSRGETFARDGRGRRGKFALSPRLEGTLRYTVSSAATPASSYRLGTHTIQNEEHYNGRLENALKGEYGVFTTLHLVISNRTDDPAPVAFYQSAHGGESTASYIIDGRLYESSVMPCPENAIPPRHKIKVYEVPAHATIFSTVLTMPDSASNSPVVLSLDRADQTPNPCTEGSLVSMVLA